ncbi:Protein-export protein SecB [Dyadobacter sp. CECT 9623]|uniref:Protein-export protein SecB n=1 Tax=Dyadobacter linearis TaxID=2823330 RepID=A0ABM8UVN6_9BACT|nr:protein-export chaperone SecB [Dyadobacter sp. CECT 9623]CAG5072865.1 Protein-export protein SecB [Dyadobacter sp. CECT 9623]
MASFSIKKVYLVESDFKYNPEVSTSESARFDLEVTMSRMDTDNGDTLISLGVKVIAFSGDASLLTVTARMDGIFDFNLDGAGPAEDYLANVNAPAIIYPFVREHIASLTAKAGVDALLIPPFNFVDHYQRLKEKTTSESDEK